ncbi:MAG: hypothetical protein HQM16_08380 [Deltaproteobacteria bacterium]|nr:hypothetical protein [Deltaproteobacteria bacterium]
MGEDAHNNPYLLFEWLWGAIAQSRRAAELFLDEEIFPGERELFSLSRLYYRMAERHPDLRPQLLDKISHFVDHDRAAFILLCLDCKDSVRRFCQNAESYLHTVNTDAERLSILVFMFEKAPERVYDILQCIRFLSPDSRVAFLGADQTRRERLQGYLLADPRQFVEKLENNAFGAPRETTRILFKDNKELADKLAAHLAATRGMHKSEQERLSYIKDCAEYLHPITALLRAPQNQNIEGVLDAMTDKEIAVYVSCKVGSRTVFAEFEHYSAPTQGRLLAIVREYMKTQMATCGREAVSWLEYAPVAAAFMDQYPQDTPDYLAFMRGGQLVERFQEIMNRHFKKAIGPAAQRVFHADLMPLMNGNDKTELARHFKAILAVTPDPAMLPVCLAALKICGSAVAKKITGKYLQLIKSSDDREIFLGAALEYEDAARLFVTDINGYCDRVHLGEATGTRKSRHIISRAAESYAVKAALLNLFCGNIRVTREQRQRVYDEFMKEEKLRHLIPPIGHQFFGRNQKGGHPSASGVTQRSS